MDTKSEALQLLENLFNQASATERRMLIQTMRIVNADQCSSLETIIAKQHVQVMPLDAILSLVATQKNIATDEAKVLISNLIFEHMLIDQKLAIVELVLTGSIQSPPSVAVTPVASQPVQQRPKLPGTPIVPPPAVKPVINKPRPIPLPPIAIPPVPTVEIRERVARISPEDTQPKQEVAVSPIEAALTESGNDAQESDISSVPAPDNIKVPNFLMPKGISSE